MVYVAAAWRSLIQHAKFGYMLWQIGQGLRVKGLTVFPLQDTTHHTKLTWSRNIKGDWLVFLSGRRQT